MDNITHTLMGGLLAESVCELSPPSPEASARRRLFWAAALIGSNLPDADLLYASWIMPAPLGYLLHHRGHTHTLLAVVPGTLVIYAFLKMFARRGRWNSPASQDWITAVALAFTSLVLHLVADSWNTYGIHPFYPFDNRWFYRDAVFVVEPALWILLGSALLPGVRRGVPRLAMSFFLAASPALLTLTRVWTVAFWPALTAAGALLCWVQSRLARGARLALSAALVAAFLAAQFAASSRARMLLHDALARNVRTSIKDIALTPIPMNPVCWSAITVETNGIVEVTRRASVSLAPWLIKAGDCPSLEATTSGAPALLPATEHIAWIDEFRWPLDDFRRLEARDCWFAAWLKFARVPYARNLEAMDLRYGYQGRRNFSTLDLGGNDRGCPRFVPPWTPPREDLLRGR